MIKKYTRKPETILAMKWTGSNPNKAYEFTNCQSMMVECTGGKELVIPAPFLGDIIVPEGDYIIKDKDGDIYMLSAGEFERQYEESL